MDDNTAHIHPDVCFAGTSCAIEKRETYLPSDSFGWRKTNTVLLNPDTIEMLGILPRSPCLLTGQSTSSRIVVVWPCAEVCQKGLFLYQIQYLGQPAPNKRTQSTAGKNGQITGAKTDYRTQVTSTVSKR
jgi:hypothetical protein